MATASYRGKGIDKRPWSRHFGSRGKIQEHGTKSKLFVLMSEEKLRSATVANGSSGQTNAAGRAEKTPVPPARWCPRGGALNGDLPSSTVGTSL
jgi:hypothetical protein